jgi:hypothetical protein
MKSWINTACLVHVLTKERINLFELNSCIRKGYTGYFELCKLKRNTSIDVKRRCKTYTFDSITSDSCAESSLYQ